MSQGAATETIRGQMNALARTIAQKNGLVQTDGSIVCWECRAKPALLPSLHCPHCLHAKRVVRERRLELERGVLASHYAKVCR